MSLVVQRVDILPSALSKLVGLLRGVEGEHLTPLLSHTKRVAHIDVVVHIELNPVVRTHRGRGGILREQSRDDVVLPVKLYAGHLHRRLRAIGIDTAGLA